MGVYTGQKLCGSTFYAHRPVMFLAAFKVAAMTDDVKFGQTRSFPEIGPSSHRMTIDNQVGHPQTRSRYTSLLDIIVCIQ